MKIITLKILFVLTVLLGASPVFADQIENVVIDENGNGTWVNASGVEHTFAGARIIDPSGGTTANALVYDTLVAFTGGNQVTGFTFSQNGDYNIYTRGATPAEDVLAGIVRFYGGHYMIFYDNDQGFGQSLADQSGLPADPLLPSVPLYQTLIGDPSETYVTPVAGMAGFANASLVRDYTFLSVIPVPEPGVFSLLACGVALLGLRRKRPAIG